MRILLCGDIVGRAGRDIVLQHIPGLRRRLALDFVIVNGENAAHGFGITDKICLELYAGGVDAITTGNHVWDKREIAAYIGDDPRLLRPINFPAATPGLGAHTYMLADGRKLRLVNAMGRLFMDALDDPFAAVARELAAHPLGSVHAFVLDFHAEASSEKMAMGHFADGKASLVAGTHTHVPTADAQILPGGTAYQTDAGMCGDYDSVIGMQKANSVARFVTKMPGERMQVAEGEASLCAIFVETDDATGLAKRVAPVRVGGRLREEVPER